MIEQLHQNHRLFAALHEQVGFAAARPVAQPVDVRRVAAAAVEKRGIDAFLFHQAVNRLMAPLEFIVGKYRIVGSLPHGKRLPEIV